MPAFYLTHLYPNQMSIYGDFGNVIAIKKKLVSLGYQVVYQEVNPGDSLPLYSDFYFIGGGQDKEQLEICEDLFIKKEKLLENVEIGIPLLSICGGYQLLGEKFITGEGVEIRGIGLFPVETRAPDSNIKSRCIGNIVVKCLIPELKDIFLVGFENHSGQTYFTQDTKKISSPLANTLTGFGNNSVEKHEGCVYKNAIGTYLHGSCLPKNPELANWLILKALETKLARESGKSISDNLDLEFLNDDISKLTRDFLVEKFS